MSSIEAISNSTNSTTFVCPSCTAPLQLSKVSEGQTISCSICGIMITPAIGKSGRHDARARLSLVLGLLSVIFGIFTGIPATVIGIKTLKKIRRGEASEKGAQFARVGVALGATTTIASFMLIGSIVAIILVAINYSVFYENPGSISDVKHIEAIRDRVASIPELPGVQPRRGIIGMNIFRLVTLADRKLNDEPEISLGLVQVRNGVFFLNNETFAKIFKDEFKNKVRVTSQEDYVLQNEYGSFDLNVVLGKNRQGKFQKQILARVPLKSQSVIVQLVLYEIEDQQNSPGIEGAIEENKSGNVQSMDEDRKPRFRLSDKEVWDFFKNIKAAGSV